MKHVPFNRFALFFVAVGLCAPLVVSAELAAQSDTPKFELPIACVPGESCWVVNYFDHDPGPGRQDYKCGPQSYDGHGGTDIAVRDLAVMADGVEVRAAAPGVVRATRDGMPDVSVKEIGREAIEGQECGNGVLINHQGGWSSQYCHLRQGSVAVKQGDEVATGQHLGMVGLSGFTEFPHLEFTVRHRKKKVDPFVGLERSTDCGLGEVPLWSEAAFDRLAYEPVAIYNAGFAPGVPEARDIRRGRYNDSVLSTSAKALVLWVEMFNVRKGDELAMRIVAPDGAQLINDERTFEKTQARRFQYVGLPRKSETWPGGIYRGEIVVTRQGEGGEIQVHRDVEIELR